MQRTVAEIAIRHGVALLGPNCMGAVDWTTNSSTYIGDVNPWLPRGHVAGLAQSGSVTDAFLHAPGTRIGYSRIVSVGAEVVLDLCDYLAYCLDDPETHAVMLFVEGFKRPERFLALADRALAMGKPILAVKVGRSAQAQAAAIAHSGSLAGEDRVTTAALDAAGVIRCADLDELLEAGGAGRRHRATRPAAARRADGRRDGVDRRGVARGRPRRADRPRPAAGDPPRPATRSSPTCPRWATSATRSTRGARPRSPSPTGSSFEALAASGAYDVLAVVHDNPFRDLPSEVDVARTVSRALIDATAAPARAAAGLRVADLERRERRGQGVPRRRRRHADAQGRGGGVRRDRRGWRRGRIAARAVRRRVHGGRAGRRWRPTTSPGASTRSSTRSRWRRRRGAPIALSERESLERLADAGHRRDGLARGRCGTRRRDPAPGASSAAGRSRSSSTPHRLAHKSDAGGVALSLTDEAGITGAVHDLAVAAARSGVGVRGLLVEPMAAAGGRADRRRATRPRVRAGGPRRAGRDPGRGARRRRGAAGARARGRGRGGGSRGLRGAALLRGVRGTDAVDVGAIVGLVVALGDLLVADPAIVGDRPQPGDRLARAAPWRWTPWSSWTPGPEVPAAGASAAPRQRHPTRSRARVVSGRTGPE